MTSLINKDFQCPSEFKESRLFPDQEIIGDLDDSHELILIKTPSDFDFEKLNGQQISLTGRQEVESSDGKRMIIDVSSSSKHLENLCFLKKLNNSDECVPVGVRFKGQIDVYEQYSFPRPVIPVPAIKQVLYPVKLGEEFLPYGSGDPVVYYKSKKKAKRKKEVSPDHRQIVSPEKDLCKSFPKRKVVEDSKVETKDPVGFSGQSEQENSSPGHKKNKKKKYKSDFGSPPITVEDVIIQEVKSETKFKKEHDSVSSWQGKGEEKVAKVKCKRVKCEVKDQEENENILHSDQELEHRHKRSPKKDKVKLKSNKRKSLERSHVKLETKVKVKSEPESGDSSEY